MQMQLIKNFEIIDCLEENCEVCQKFKKPKPKPNVGFPLAKRFNQTVTLHLKEWSSSSKIWFLHLTDHFTCFSASCVVSTNDHFISLCVNLNIQICKTAAESPCHGIMGLLNDTMQFWVML